MTVKQRSGAREHERARGSRCRPAGALRSLEPNQAVLPHFHAMHRMNETFARRLRASQNERYLPQNGHRERI